MEIAHNLWAAIIAFLELPAVRAAATVIAIVSAALGLWSTRKAQQVLRKQEDQIVVTQLQSLNDQWQKINLAVLSNDDVTRTLQTVLGARDAEDFRRHTFFQLLVNLLFQAWVSMHRGIIEEETYNAHFTSVAYYFSNRKEPFFAIALPSDYTTKFVEDCRRRFTNLTPLTRLEVSNQIHDFARLLDDTSTSLPAPT